MSLQVSITSSVFLNGEHPNTNIDSDEKEYRCMRCGTSMEKSKSVFVNIQPPIFQPKKNCSSMSMEILSKSNGSNASLESSIGSSCVEYCLSKSSNVSETSVTDACSRDLEWSGQDESNTTVSRIPDSSSSEEDDHTSIDISVVGSRQSIKPNIRLLQPRIPNSDFKDGLAPHPCVDCHVAVLNGIAERKASGHEYISLVLQVSSLSASKESVECQTDESAFRSDVGLSVSVLEVYPKINSKCASTEGESLSGSKQDPQKNLPELDAEAEAAYRCHLKNLVPCTHCGRTFNPDRIMKHENACIERPKKRKRKGRK